MAKGQGEFFSVAQAATELALSRQGIWKQITAGTLKATKVGENYIIPAVQVRKVRKERIADLEHQLAELRQKEGRK